MGVLDRLRRPAQTAAIEPAETMAVEIVGQRAPTAATRALRWTTPGRSQPPDWDAHQAFQRAYYSNIVVYACVRLAAFTIGSLPFRVGVDPAKPNDYDTNAPLARLLGPPPGGPAPKMTARRLWAWTVGQRIVTGRNGWELEPDSNGRPGALWPLSSSELRPIPSDSGIDWFSGFEYGRRDQPRRLRSDQIVYDWDPSGTDFRQPESALEAAHLDINVAVMQSRYDWAFLKNDARPPAIVVTEEFEDADSFEAFKRQWNAEHAGVDNAGKVGFLEAKGTGEQGVKGSVDVSVLGFSPKDAQAAQRHADAMERIAIALGTPWSLLDASGRTYDNAGQEWRNYVQHRILPLAMDMADMVNLQLAGLFGDGKVGWFDTARLGIEAMDRVDAQGAALLFQAEVITRDEARAPFGLPAVPGGDQFGLGAGAPAAVPPPVSAPAPDPAPPVPPDPAPAPREVPSPEVRDVPVETRALTAEEQEIRRARIWTSANGTVTNLERIWERAWRRIFTRQERSAVARLEAKRGRSAMPRGARALSDEVFDRNHWAAETEDEARALYEAVTAAGGARVSHLFGLAFDLEAPYAQAFVHARANQLAGPVTDTTYEAIQATLSEGIQAGEGIPDLAARIRGVFDQAKATRAATIARTEVISAYNGSAVTVASQLGSDVVGGQEWIATRDGRTRDSHVEIDGTVVGMADVFPNGLAYPGDPAGDAGEVVNCRCTVAFLTPDEMGDATAGRGRMVERRVAHAVLGLIRPGPFDEASLRAALAEAA